ncbi:ROK family transcriptional regulator [Subtercola lobariae]|uniref:NagC family transcriptional regulator n=1 Tax=Subtercola lobariae TaxID=1588641 RepID=A0A917BE47_9MICO|nr:ROK family transcriptional regulator [Subtercola lobariae]GGF39275.1 NagC family transcriptional regulator [Subtercola lobariae]
MQRGAGTARLTDQTTAVSSDVRRHNLSIVASFLAANGPHSRSQLAAATGLTRGSVTALVGALMDARLVTESTETLEPPNDTAPAKGRPNTLLELSGDHLAILALQLDAESVTALLTTVSGVPLLRIVENHGRPMGDPERVLEVLAAVLVRALTESELIHRAIADLTVVVFAPVAGDPPMVRGDSDLDWLAVDVIGALRARIPDLDTVAATIRLVSDGGLAALAEFEQLDDVTDLLYLKSNSGIGGASIIAGELMLGWQGMAGAFGHLALYPQGSVCACGQRGCLVTLAGPDVVLAAAGLNDVQSSEGLSVALAEFVTRVRRGEPRASAAWANAVNWISLALHILVNATDPEVIVLGGFWAELRDEIAAQFALGGPTVFSESQFRHPPVLAGVLGADAALLGAIRSARDRLLADPLAPGHSQATID